MKNTLLFLLLAAMGPACAQQKPIVVENVINTKETERIERYLASDDLQGRRAGSPGADKAADFIAAEFKSAGLQPLEGNSFLQTFQTVRPRLAEASGQLNGKPLPARSVVVVSAREEVKGDEKAGWTVVRIGAGENLFERASALVASGKNSLILVDTAFSANFPRLQFFSRQLIAPAPDIVFVLSNETPVSFSVQARQTLETVTLKNVAGVLRGKSKPEEYVIFSGHYDHLGIGRPTDNDSIFNGANDDAAGVTAVILLSKYFKQMGGNERSLVFVAFTAEEIGGYGAQYFSRRLHPDQVVAMFNIEMIGTESKWGPNSAYITGFEQTNMGTILQKNLQGTSFTFHPDPYPSEQLFYRSDNATLARKGVAAHTISTSKMDSEKYYHTVDDEVETLDLKNMTAIIRAIAQSASSIISGQDTPSRVKVENLR